VGRLLEMHLMLKFCMPGRSLPGVGFVPVQNKNKALKVL
jgi:hypothetical protein